MVENERAKLIAAINLEEAELEALGASVSRLTTEGLIGWLVSKLAALTHQTRKRFA